ncbi:MAG TPA: ATP synthase subunit I [Kofleriaceae bacterium]|nr:ATP synthase subunit I [Kofleriaceae bacterium]
MGSPSIHRIERLNYAISAIAIVASLVTQSRSITLGLAVGAALTCLNFYVLRRLIVKWTTDAAQGKSGNSALLMLPKMIGMMGAVAVAVLFLPINVIAFAAGYSIFIVSIIVETLYSAFRPAPESDDNADTRKQNGNSHG